MSNFTNIGYEVYINGTWVDLSADVLAEPAPHCSRGIQGNKPDDCVADVGRLTFSLDNSEFNSAGLIGYYSPGHANCLSGWTTSLAVRLYFDFDTWHYIKWMGLIEFDGITVIPFAKGPRRVDVRCVDWMAIASEHKIDLLKAYRNQWAYQAIRTVISNMPFGPQDVLFIDEANETDIPRTVLPVVFDVSGTETTALGEFQKIAMSQYLNIFLRGGNDGDTLCTLSQSNISASSVGVVSASSGKFLLETGDKLLLEDGSFLLLDETATCSLTASDLLNMDIVYGGHLINHLTEIVTPRKMDAAATTVLYTLDRTQEVVVGTPLNMRAAYRDPNAQATKVNIDVDTAVAPVANTDYKANAAEDGSGTDKTSSLSVLVTFGAAEADVTLTNTDGAGTIYVGGTATGTIFQLRGKGVYTYDPIRFITKDVTSIIQHGSHPFNYEYFYRDKRFTYSNGTRLGDTIITQDKDAKTTVESITLIANKNDTNMTYFLFWEPGTIVEVAEDVAAIAYEHFPNLRIMGYEFDIVGKEIVNWTGITKSTTVI